MPPSPENVEEKIVLSDDYQNDKIVLSIYTNSSLAVERETGNPGQRVWFDGLEKRALYEALADHLGEIEEVTVEIAK